MRVGEKALLRHNGKYNTELCWIQVTNQGSF
jgi:hypothetical protein